jgi:hypothetical protein
MPTDQKFPIVRNRDGLAYAAGRNRKARKPKNRFGHPQEAPFLACHAVDPALCAPRRASALASSIR